MNRLLVTLEGIDGTGKSTLAHNLQSRLRDEHLDVVLTREPGATTLGKKLRTILHEEKECISDESEYLLFAADRAQHFQEIVIPALEAGKIVLSDRMADSSIAYQGYGRNLDIPVLQTINKWAMHGIVPHLTLYLELPMDTAIKRFTKRAGAPTSFEKEAQEFWKRVLNGYEEIFKTRDDVVRLDATQPPDALAELAVLAILPRIGN